MDRVLAGLTRALDGLLRRGAGLVPPGRREWASAVRAEAGEVPAGAARLGWLAGGLWLVVREAQMVRRIVYALAMAAVAVTAVAVMRYFWGGAQAGPEAGWDKARVVLLVVLLAGLPWVARGHGVFGPVGRGILARLIRAGGAAAVLALILDIGRLKHFAVMTPGAWDWAREAPGLALIAAVLAAVLVVVAKWPRAHPVAVAWCAAAACLAVIWLAPLQVLITVYVAGLLALTSRRSPVTQKVLAICVGSGAAGGLAVVALWDPTRSPVAPGVHHKQTDVMLLLLVLLVVIAAGTAAAARAVWRAKGPDDLLALRRARISQCLAAGPLTGATAALMLPLLRADPAVRFAAVCHPAHPGWCSAAPGLWAFFLVVGPLLGLAIGSAAGGIIAGPPPPAPPAPPGEPSPKRSWSAGIFARSS